MNKRDYDRRQRYRELQNTGWQVTIENNLRPNDGSESFEHYMAKAVTCHILEGRGLGYSTEVEHNHRGEIDVLWHGPEDGAALAIEIQDDMSDETLSDKLDRYVHGTPIRDMLVINLDDLPEDMIDWRQHIKTELFG